MAGAQGSAEGSERRERTIGAVHHGDLVRDDEDVVDVADGLKKLYPYVYVSKVATKPPQRSAESTSGMMV